MAKKTAKLSKGGPGTPVPIESVPFEVRASKEELMVKALGMLGHLVSQSKSDYYRRHPTHKVFFNANVFDGEAKKLWFGDIDLSLSAGALQRLANLLGETLYVTHEMPYRFVPPMVKDFKEDPDVVAFEPAR